MMKANPAVLFLFCIFIFLIACQNHTASNGIHPYKLRCEQLHDPIGIDTPVPRLSWKLVSQEYNESQSAYQILVAGSKAALDSNQGDLWDSEKVTSDQSIHVPYNGQHLESGMDCWWKVRVWNKDSVVSAWSETAHWSMGILNESDWQAQWIGLDRAVGNDDPDAEYTRLSARYLRKEFTPDKEIVKATARICGLGLYEFYLNGAKVGDDVLSPAQTQFNKRSLYVSYDVTDHVIQGSNAVGVILGNGRFFPMRHTEPMIMRGFGYPKLFFQLELKYKDGSNRIIASDDSWKITANGPITENNEYDGEKYDARKEMPGWERPGFDDSGWLPVEIVERPSEKICAQMNEPIRITQTIRPVAFSEQKPGVYIFDMGQNMVGWVELIVNGQAGDQIKLRFAETLNSDGSLYLDNIRTAKVTDIYTCKGDGQETWQPRFTYHGFRYVEMTGYPGVPDQNSITGKVVHDEVTPTGEFECSIELINRIYRNAVWGIRGNYRSFPTDCPQRDERMSWLGDRATGSRGESYIFDIDKLYSKWMQDIGDAQLVSGSIPDVCPAYWELYNDNVTWDGTPIMLANMLYQQYGDAEVIRGSYDYLKKWYDHMVSAYLYNGIIPRDSYGDWCVPPEEPTVIHSINPDRMTSGSLLGTAYFIHMSGLMSQFAKLLEKPGDADHFTQLKNEMTAAFNEHFLNKETGIYANNSPTAGILALAFDLAPENLRQKVLTNLVKRTETEFKGHIPTGLVGAQFLMRTLTRTGYPELALRFATQTDYPSWGYMVEQGATTIWELWNGNTADPAMNSDNHVMLLGDFNIWLYEDLAGIKPLVPGFKEIMMKPAPIAGLDFVKATHESPYGKIASSWKIKNGKFNWDVSIPVNTSARIYVPGENSNEIKINGVPVQDLSIVQILESDNKYTVIRCGSGEYHITSTHFTPFMDKLSKKTSPPEIILPATVSDSPVTAEIRCPDQNAEIRYTLDCAEPDENATLYTGPITIEKSGTLTARAFKKGKEPSFSIAENIDIYSKENNGLTYSYYQGRWTKLPDFTKLPVIAAGRINNIGDLAAIKQREDYWGIVFEGVIKFDKPGEYIFSIASDDGTRLYIDNQLIIDNDGIHGVMEKQGTIELAKGRFPIRIEYFEGNYGEDLILAYSGPGISRRPLPQSILFFE